MQQNAATSHLLRTLNIVKMSKSEVPPGTAGNLSLRDHSDVHNRKSTAPAAPPQNSAMSEP